MAPTTKLRAVSGAVRGFLRADPLVALSQRLGNTAFGAVVDAEAEHRKLNVIRVVVGIVGLIRTLLVAYGAFAAWPADSWHGLAALGLAALFLLLAAGVLTPVALFALIAFYPGFDLYQGTFTLGSLVMMCMLIYLWLAGAGSIYSVDAMLMRRGRALAALAGAAYRVLGVGGVDRLTVLRFGLFFAYAAISFGAVLHHVLDPYWQSGEAVSAMMTSAFHSRVYEPARWFDEHFSSLSHAISVITVRFQLVWQLFMVPLVLFRTGYLFVALWGAMFAAVSVVVFRLSYLPYVELCLWAAVFLLVRERTHLELLYDDRSRLWTRAVKALRVLDPLGVYAYRPLSGDGQLAVRHTLAPETVGADIHGVWRDRVYAGYRVFEQAARRNPLLWIAYPLLVVGRWLRVGPMLYRRATRDHARTPGAGESWSPAAPAQVAAPARRRGIPWLASGLSFAWLAATVVFVLQLPPIESSLTKVGFPYHRLPTHTLEEATRRLGLVEANVFNSPELQITQNWAMIYRQEDDGTWKLVPWEGRDGQRLSYYRSDVLLYGFSVGWRWTAKDSDLIAMHQPGGNGQHYLDLVMLYDKQRQSIDGPARYRVDIYHSRAADYTLDVDERFAATRVYTYFREL